MFKKTIKYTDYNGDKRTEDFYFHLSIPELAEMTWAHDGDLSAVLKQVGESGDPGLIMSTFRDILGKSVGHRSEDGRRFTKSKEITAEFMQSPAYEEFFMELVTSASLASDFVRGVVPGDLTERFDEVNLPDDREYTHQELIEMSELDFLRVAGTDPKHMSKAHLIAAMARKEHLKQVLTQQ